MKHLLTALLLLLALPAFASSTPTLNGSETVTVKRPATGSYPYGQFDTTTQAIANLSTSGGGTPGGSTGQIQYNNNGSFGGLAYVPVASGGTGASSLDSANAITSFVKNPVSGATAEYPMDDGINGSNATTIADISGNGNTGILGTSTNAPIWRTWGLSFNDGGITLNADYVTLPVTTWKTVIMDVCPVQMANTSGATGLQQPANASFLAFSSSTTSGGIALTYSPAYNRAGFQGFFPGTYYNATTYTTTAANPTIGCNTIAWTLDTLDHIYVNGVEVQYASQGTAVSSATTVGGTYVLGGKQTTTGGLNMSGTINYAVFYPGVLTQDQVLQVTNFIQQQVSKRRNYPNNITKSTLPSNQLICAGDSLEAGFRGSTEWCASSYVTPLNNAYNIQQWGFGSDTAIGEEATSSNRWLSNLSPIGKNYCHHWIGTNDMINQFSAAQTWGALMTIAKQDRAAGCIPILSTMISRVPYGGITGDTVKKQLNLLERAGWQQAGFAFLDDLAAIPALGADGAYTNSACFYSDELHLVGPGAGTCVNSLTGYGEVALQLSRSINILDGATVSTPTVTTSNAYVEVDADNYVVQTPTAAATNQLIDCTGFTGLQRTINNLSGTYTITATTSNSQTISGSAAIAPNSIGTFTCELTSLTAGGNYWLRTQ